jgi:hypothetical protein
MTAAVNPEEAFAAIPLAAVCCDSSFNHREGQVVRQQLEPRWPYREMTPEALGTLLDGLLMRIREGGWGRMVDEAAAALTPEQRETAFAIATEIIFSNHWVTAEEQRFLSQLAEALPLPTDRARRIIEVFYILKLDALREVPSQPSAGG